MSIKAITQVWNHSQHKGSELLVLLALADHTNARGYAYPSIERLAKRTRMSVRNVQLILRKLAKHGELTVGIGDGPHGCNLYKICLDGQTGTYTEYLLSEHWQAVRKEALQRAKFRCQLCNTLGPLHVHHRSYAHLGEEHLHMHDVIVLCAPCHAKHHDIPDGRGAEK